MNVCMRVCRPPGFNSACKVGWGKKKQRKPKNPEPASCAAAVTFASVSFGGTRPFASSILYTSISPFHTLLYMEASFPSPQALPTVHLPPKPIPPFLPSCSSRLAGGLRPGGLRGLRQPHVLVHGQVVPLAALHLQHHDLVLAPRLPRRPLHDLGHQLLVPALHQARLDDGQPGLVGERRKAVRLELREWMAWTRTRVEPRPRARLPRVPFQQVCVILFYLVDPLLRHEGRRPDFHVAQAMDDRLGRVERPHLLLELLQCGLP